MMTTTTGTGVLRITMSALEFAEKLGLTTDRTRLTPVRVDIDDDGDAVLPEGGLQAVSSSVTGVT